MLTKRKKIFVTGLHNIGYIAALVLMVLASSKIVGHFLFCHDFEIIEVRTQCEQPLNNRCDYLYRIETRAGVKSWENLVNFRANEGDLQVGSHIEKAKYQFAYKVNGVPVPWKRWPEFWLALSGAIIFAGMARLATPRRRASM